jgi:hypothetical protein
MSSAASATALKVASTIWKWRTLGWRDAVQESAGQGGPDSDWIAAQLLTNLQVEPLPNSSHVVSVSYEAAAIKDVANIANSFKRRTYHYHTGAHARAWRDVMPPGR